MGLACTGGWGCGVNINNMDKLSSCDYLIGDFLWCGRKQSSGRKSESGGTFG